MLLVGGGPLRFSSPPRNAAASPKAAVGSVGRSVSSTLDQTDRASAPLPLPLLAGLAPPVTPPPGALSTGAATWRGSGSGLPPPPRQAHEARYSAPEASLAPDRVSARVGGPGALSLLMALSSSGAAGGGAGGLFAHASVALPAIGKLPGGAAPFNPTRRGSSLLAADRF
jgi:hypothetical protein